MVNEEENVYTYTFLFKFQHEGWGVLPGFSFDVAVIKLTKKIDFNNTFVKMITIANTTDNFDGANCTISGWGVTTIGK